MRPTLTLTASYAAASIGLVAVLSAATSASPQTAGPSERFAAFAVDVSAASPSRCGPVEITITRWSTDKECRILIDQLLSDGPNAWLDTLSHSDPVGRLQTAYSTAYPLRFAQAIPDNSGGRHIVLAADRPVTFWQVWNAPMSAQLPFSVIELHVDSAGEGEGRLWVPGRIAADRETNTIELDGYSGNSVLLTSLRTLRPTT
jgi:hypothetical protein